MGHDWIFDVLTDLRSYAEKNGLPQLAKQAETAIDVARKELNEKIKAAQANQDQH